MRRPWQIEDGSAFEQTNADQGWHVETLALLTSLFFVVFCNLSFWQSIMTPDRLGRTSGGLFIAATGLALIAVHFVLLALLFNRWTIRWLAPVLLCITASAAYFMGRYHVYIDPSMLRNVLATDVGEARDLMSWSLLPYLLLLGILPGFLLSRLKLRRLPLHRAFLRRVLAIVLALLLGAGAVFAVFQEMSSTMRNDKGLRYLATPANLLYSLPRAMMSAGKSAVSERKPIGEDAVLGAQVAGRKKPVVLLMVLGETARAANWGLSGYARQTTPALAAAGVINFASVTSCGTNTETSLPCIFSQVGRRHYDEDRIRGEQGLLDVARRAGYRVVWVDNQSGCKGVCDGVESTRPEATGQCKGGECMDEMLLASLKQTVESTPGNLLVVLHQMGNHGPAYFKRYPPAFAAYEPACKDADLAHCDQQAIVNAYDNAIRYTDHVLASSITYLKGLQTHDPAMLYVSDHGESLGEKGLFLHGIPYAIAPEVQTRVPMVMWFSPAWRDGFAVDEACVARRAEAPATHDHLFHTLLGMLDISTTVYEREMDLLAGCRAR